MTREEWLARRPEPGDVSTFKDFALYTEAVRKWVEEGKKYYDKPVQVMKKYHFVLADQDKKPYQASDGSHETLISVMAGTWNEAVSRLPYPRQSNARWVAAYEDGTPIEGDIAFRDDEPRRPYIPDASDVSHYPHTIEVLTTCVREMNRQFPMVESALPEQLTQLAYIQEIHEALIMVSGKPEVDEQIERICYLDANDPRGFRRTPRDNTIVVVMLLIRALAETQYYTHRK